jgi:two-component system, OmpR family, sensor histidine kinase CpxA
MKLRWTLSRKIACLALLNIGLLAGAALIFARSQFRFGPESLLLGPAHDRIRGVGDAFNADLDATPPSGWDQLVASYAQRYGAEFHLAGGRGNRLAGPEPPMSEPLREEMRRLLPGAGPRRPPPRRFDEGEPSPPPPRERPPMPRESVFLWVQQRPTAYWAGARIHSPSLDLPGNIAILLIRSDTVFNSRLFFDWQLWAGAALAAAGLSALCWLPFLRGLTRAIAHMDRVTKQIADGRFDIQAAEPRNDELGHLGQQIDRMAGRLESFVKNQKRFLGDIAHELCAPIARVQFAVGILEQKAEEGQRAHVAALHEEVQEMSALVNELLSFSKAGMQPGSAQLTRVSVAEVAGKAVAREAFAGGRVELAVEEGMTVTAHPALLLRALANVLRNAIRYAGDRGPIAISARKDGSRVSIVVADTGPGLPEWELEEVFAPFYRPEAARTRETGGAGLGLPIVRTCVEACGGTVSCRNRTPNGLEVVMTLKA